MQRVNIIGAEISVTNMKDVLTTLEKNIDDIKGNYICASNVHTTVMACEDLSYRQIQNNSYMTLPDGKPLSIVGKKRGFSDMERVTGPEFMENVLQMSKQTGWKHYFYGNTQENLEILIKHLKKKYPFLNIAGYESSKFRELTQAEEKELIQNINNSKADFVWVALGAPRQEIFCAKHCSDTNSVWVGVGGAFNVIAGIIPRAPQWMQKYCLEWFYRLMKEPKRLFKRYFVTNTKFLYYLVKSKNKSR